MAVWVIYVAQFVSVDMYSTVFDCQTVCLCVCVCFVFGRLGLRLVLIFSENNIICLRFMCLASVPPPLPL